MSATFGTIILFTHLTIGCCRAEDTADERQLLLRFMACPIRVDSTSMALSSCWIQCSRVYSSMWQWEVLTFMTGHILLKGKEEKRICTILQLNIAEDIYICIIAQVLNGC